MAGFLSAAIAAISSSSIGSAIVRIIVAYGVSRLINKSTGNQNQQQVDSGIRLQLQPDTTNPIPLLYGSAYYSGNITDAQLTNSNKTMWVCLTLSEHTATNRLSDNSPVDTFIDNVYFDNQLVTFKSDGITVDYVTNTDGTVDTSARDLVKIYLYKNGSNNPTLPSSFLSGGTLPGAAHTLFPGWDSSWTMSNLTFALVRIDYNRDKGITGIPTLKFKVSNTLYKPGDALYDYMTNTVSGAALPVSQIDTASLVALNDYADDDISFYNEDTQTTQTLSDRYQINGIINPQQNVLANMQELANSCGVYINYDIATGKWGTIIDRDNSAVYHFDDSNVIGGIDISATSLDNMYNSVEVSFPSRLIQDQTDTIYITLPNEYRNANEPDHKLSIRLSMLNEPVQARELGYLALYQSRLDRVVTFTTDYSKISVAAGDVITLTNSVYGFVNQEFRVVRVKEVESDSGSILIEIVAQEYDATLYTAGGQARRPRTPTASINLPSKGVIATPNAPLVTTANNNRQPSILLTGTVPSGVIDRFEFWYSTDNWTTSFLLHEEKNSNGSPFNSGVTILARISTLQSGTYKFKVRAGNEQSFSNYSESSTELTWAPVQTTDAVTASTSFSVSDLLPVLGAGALAYFAYKALYPDLVKALSNTQLGQLLGIEDPDAAALAKDKLAQEATAFRIVTAGGVQMTPEVDNSLTFIAGNGIQIAVTEGTHDIKISATGGEGSGFTSVIVAEDTINSVDVSNNLTFVAGSGIKLTTSTVSGSITIDNTCCTGDNLGNSDTITDVGVPKFRKLDYCESNYEWPTKIKTIIIPGTPEIPAVPAGFNYITQGGEFFDPCYKKNVSIIVIPKLTVDSGIVEHLGNHVYSTYTGILWYGSKATTLANKTIRMISVGDHKFIAMRNWDPDTGATLPLNNDEHCSLDPNDRPLFPSVDYPSGYALMTYAEFQGLLENTSDGLKFTAIPAKAAIPAVPDRYKYKTYKGITEPVILPRRHIEGYETVKSYGTRTSFTGLIQYNSLLSTTNIPIGSIISGTYTNNVDKIEIIPCKVIELVDTFSNGYKIYLLDVTHTTGSTSADSAYITMYYKKDVTEIVTTEYTRDASVT